MSQPSSHVAVVTGTSSGIGFATALHLARNGYRVFAGMRNLEKAAPLVDAARSEGLALEVIELVRTWQVIEGTPPAQAFFLSLQPEASSFTLPVFASTRSPSGAPRLRLTYVYPLDFEEP